MDQFMETLGRATASAGILELMAEEVVRSLHGGSPALVGAITHGMRWIDVCNLVNRLGAVVLAPDGDAARQLKQWMEQAKSAMVSRNRLLHAAPLLPTDGGYQTIEKRIVKDVPVERLEGVAAALTTACNQAVRLIVVIRKETGNPM